MKWSRKGYLKVNGELNVFIEIKVYKDGCYIVKYYNL